jgi:hypothetical protein
VVRPADLGALGKLEQVLERLDLAQRLRLVHDLLNKSGTGGPEIQNNDVSTY